MAGMSSGGDSMCHEGEGVTAETYFWHLGDALV